MKKIGVLFCLAVSVAGCSSNQSKEQMFIEAAQACNQVCQDNPYIDQVSSSAGGGVPLFLMGGKETSCRCHRQAAEAAL